MAESKQEPREAWSEVGRQFEELGRAPRGHFEKEPATEPPAAAEAGAAEAGAAQPGAAEAGGAEAGAAEAGAAESASPGSGGAEAGGSAAGDRAAMRDALRKLGQAAQRLGDQAGEAVRDREVRESAQRVARTFADALDATFTDLGEEIRGRVRARRGSDPADQDAPSTQPPAAKEIGGGPGAPDSGEPRPPGAG